MARFSVLSWNIEHFNGHGGTDRRNRAARLNRVTDVAHVLQRESPDVFGLSEVEGSIVFDAFTRLLPDYSFHITEGKQSQEILIGVRRSWTAFFTQRNEFKRSNPYLRPGALLSIRRDSAALTILFTHLKSMTSPEGFGLRDAMFNKVFNLKKALDKASANLGQGPANFIVVGDMNTMGMNYHGRRHDIPGTDEIRAVTSRFKQKGMKALRKSHPFTFNNGSDSRYPQSDLDHVFAASHLQFDEMADVAEVRVGGWAEAGTPREQDEWITRFSDHAPLTFRVSDF